MGIFFEGDAWSYGNENEPAVEMSRSSMSVMWNVSRGRDKKTHRDSAGEWPGGLELVGPVGHLGCQSWSCWIKCLSWWVSILFVPLTTFYFYLTHFKNGNIYFMILYVGNTELVFQLWLGLKQSLPWVLEETLSLTFSVTLGLLTLEVLWSGTKCTFHPEVIIKARLSTECYGLDIT